LILWYIGLWAIDSLFNLHFSKIYPAYFALVFILFAGIYFMWEIKNNKKDFKYSKFLNFILTYVLIPAVFIYFIILTIYDIKLLFSIPNWPSRMVPYLIIAFSLIGYFVYIISYKLESWKLFKKWFPRLVLIQLPVLFISIYLRVSQYDLTFNRYLLIIAFIILTIISIYYTFSKKKHLSWIFIISAVILALTSIWPCSIDNLPKTRQVNKLTEILKTNNLLTWNNINIEKLQNSSEATKQLVADKVRYLCSYHNCEKIELFKPILKDLENKEKTKFEEYKKQKIEELKKWAYTEEELKEIENEQYKWLSKYDMKYRLLNQLGLDSYYYYDDTTTKYFDVSNPKYQNTTNVFGYSYIIDVINEKYKRLNHNWYFVTIDSAWNVYLYEDKKLVDKKQIPQEKLKELFNLNKTELDKPLEFTFNMWDYEIKLILKYFNLSNYWDKIKITYFNNTSALLRRK